jgi:hypothetical protein
MKTVGAVAALAAAGVTLWCGEAVAYRPFDGTDAAVAETGEIEVEFGPVEYLRVGAEHMLFTPDLRGQLRLRLGVGSITRGRRLSWFDGRRPRGERD